MVPSSNVLTNSDGSSKQAGVALKLNLHILNTTSCAAISGAQVDIWQANAKGVYSDESNQSTLNQTWLRDYQLTDANGLASFTTIFPGRYSGRTPHIHLMVRTLSGGGTGSNGGGPGQTTTATKTIHIPTAGATQGSKAGRLPGPRRRAARPSVAPAFRPRSPRAGRPSAARCRRGCAV